MLSNGMREICTTLIHKTVPKASRLTKKKTMLIKDSMKSNVS